MPLPVIDSYPMPGETDLPEPRVPWSVDPDRAVLLIHDMQHHFLRAYAAARPLVADLVGNIARIRDACHEAGVPVVYSAQPENQSPTQRGLQLEMWGHGIAAGDGGIVESLAPTADDRFMTKWRYSAFLHTELGDLLGAWGRDQLVVTGIYAHIGCQTTATEAFMRDVQAFLVADAVADFSLEDHLMAVRYVARRAGVATTTARVVGALDRTASRAVVPDAV
ncbi:isochorismatase family protein [Actinomycetospora endophytica]|uniref:Isochorismatase family protein n=1 Tax=Actinomycetospora endophytica TaxID=2291215 RepID=A0ABS8PH80_9PSEU|nr:isochorismatase family protein [Actinomycetospora endophytica]MCD2197605.1 isochorismatase family protein [Actinomycetospora endophytica]